MMWNGRVGVGAGVGGMGVLVLMLVVGLRLRLGVRERVGWGLWVGWFGGDLVSRREGLSPEGEDER